MKRILVTGATGFLGKYLLEALSASGNHITVLCRKIPAEKDRRNDIQYLQGDIEDPYSLTAAFREIDIVIHAAALVSVKPEENQKMYSVNFLGTRHVVNAVLEAGVQRLIHVSSVAALSGAANPENLINETAIWNGPSEGYGFTKYMAELEVYRAAAEGVEIDIINPSVILAPAVSDRSSGLLMKLAKGKLPLVPEGTVNIVDARDVVDFILKLLSRNGTGQRYILNGFILSWKEFFREVSARSGKNGFYLTIPARLAVLLTGIQEFIFFMIFRPPLITRTALKMATAGNRYNTEKASLEIGFQFRSPESTLDWICSAE